MVPLMMTETGVSKSGAQTAARRVLIVDDVPQVRAELRTLLPLAGNIEIAGEASNGLEAVRLTQDLRPDVVLMDLEMPVMNGYEATRQIKQLSSGSRVIAFTIHGYPEAFEQARQAGADAVLVKGAPLTELVQEISGKE